MGKQILIFLLIFFLGMAGQVIFHLWQVKSTESIPFTPQQSSFVLKPPSDALNGEFLLFKGNVKKKSRDIEEFKNVNAGEQVLQGEKIATGNKSQAVVEFPTLARVSLDSDTEIGFNNLVPANFLLNQLSGSATYELLRNDTSISIRCLQTLVTINFGKSEIAVNDETITVKVLSGTVKLAFVDLENNTQIWEIIEGQEALVNVTERDIEIK